MCYGCSQRALSKIHKILNLTIYGLPGKNLLTIQLIVLILRAFGFSLNLLEKLFHDFLIIIISTIIIQNIFETLVFM